MDYLKILHQFEKENQNLSVEGRHSECIITSEKALKASLLNMGMAYNSAKNFKKAIEIYKIGIKLDTTFWKFWNNLGSIYIETGYPEEGHKCVLNAIKYCGMESFLPYYNAGLTSNLMGEFKKADIYFSIAKQLSGGFPWLDLNIGLTYLRAGLYKEGWSLYDARFQTGELAMQMRNRFNFPEWQGENLTNKRLVIYNEQGLGDFVYFGRFLNYFKNKNCNIILEVQDLLESLANKNFPFCKVVTRKNNDECPPSIEGDYHLSICSLPRLLKIYSIEDFNYGNFIKSFGTKKINSKKLKVGICWCGNPSHKRDHTRSIKLKEFEKFINDESFDCYYLFKGFNTIRHWNSELVNLLDGINLDNNKCIQGGIEDLVDTIDQMDVVVTVDSAPAHIAGAMGKKTLMLLGLESDWRWCNQPEKQYSDFKVFKRKTEWIELIEEVYQEVKKFQATHEHNMA